MTHLISSVRHLSLFCAVAQRGSLSAAARAAHLSQPAATQAMASLERVFGGTLFVRTARGMQLTDAGRLCAVRFERALERILAGAAAAGAPRGEAAGSLHGITSAQLQALIAVVEAGGFGPAARALGVTRAGVHRAARQLERTLGVSLFEPTSHGVRPTREASRVALQAQLALVELAQARAEVAAHHGVDSGGTVIGAMPLARSVIVPAAALRFASRRPHHELSILDGPYEGMLDALQRGRADVLLGALRTNPPEDVRQEHLFDDPLAIVVRAGHPLVAGGRRAARAPTHEELRRYPWIAPRRGSPLRLQFDALFTGEACEPPATAIECNSLIAARAILMGSDRMMLLSAHQVHYELAVRQLAVLPHPSGRTMRAIGLTVRRDWIPTEAQRELLEVLRGQVRELGLDAAPRPAPRIRRSRDSSRKGATLRAAKKR